MIATWQGAARPPATTGPPMDGPPDPSTMTSQPRLGLSQIALATLSR
jgi:hypothetical protein